MRDVTYSLGMSLDGYVVGPDGEFAWAEPDPVLFRHSIGEVRQNGVHLLGRKLYEAMLYWEDRDPATFDEAEQEFADVWNRLPKVVFSSTLTEVRSNARLATGSVADEIERLRAEGGDGTIGIGGATLAAEAAALGLIDEYWIRVIPVLVGGGIPFFAHEERHVDLGLVETRTFAGGIVYLRYRVKR